MHMVLYSSVEYRTVLNCTVKNEVNGLTDLEKGTTLQPYNQRLCNFFWDLVKMQAKCYAVLVKSWTLAILNLFYESFGNYLYFLASQWCLFSKLGIFQGRFSCVFFSEKCTFAQTLVM